MKGGKGQQGNATRRTPNFNFASNDRLGSMRLTQKFADINTSPLSIFDGLEQGVDLFNNTTVYGTT